MRVQVEAETVHLTLSVEEATRLSVALLDSGTTTSRAEYFIRTGLSQPNVAEVARSLYEAVRDGATGLEVSLMQGEEPVENPRHPRPLRE